MVYMFYNCKFHSPFFKTRFKPSLRNGPLKSRFPYQKHGRLHMAREDRKYV